MRSRDKTKEQLIKELDRLKYEMSRLTKAEARHEKIQAALIEERGLYLDLTNVLPLGIYRLRVFQTAGLVEEKWYSSNDAPYVPEFVNDRFCEILKIDRQVFEANPGIVTGLVFEEDRAEFARKNVEANISITPFIWEGRVIINKELVWVHFESVPRVLENKDIIWTGILSDISERKKAEHEISIINQELLKANADKDKFFSILAHDLRSPFNSIAGFTGILLEQINQKDLEKIKKYAEIIRNSSQRAMDLLTNLTQWSLSQTGRMKFNPEYFKMEQAVNEMVLLFTDIAIHKSINIVKEFHAEMPVYADKDMISTVLRNLFSNAIKFTSPGGTVSISAAVNQCTVKISIRDTGVGMSKLTVDHLFRLDTNYSMPGTQNEMGTGLGLILCKDFIEKHRGKIGFESEPGKGSMFYFTIPCDAND